VFLVFSLANKIIVLIAYISFLIWCFWFSSFMADIVKIFDKSNEFIVRDCLGGFLAEMKRMKEMERTDSAGDGREYVHSVAAGNNRRNNRKSRFKGRPTGCRRWVSILLLCRPS
jgi:hypothetical protein